MTPEPRIATDIARAIADCEAVDWGDLDSSDPVLANGLRKLNALMQTLRADAASGQTWGHLQQLELAGSGAFGDVYRAYDPSLDRTIALKLKRENGSALHASGRDFVAEARRLARVRHPHVLAVHGASYHDSRAGIWSDWIDGETLSDCLRRRGRIRGPELLRILRELAEALRAIHAAGLVHGDIKASNIMLDRHQHLILMDFGAGFESSPEGSPISAGTPQYLAPEALSGHGTAAIDLYAVGVLTHLLATGSYPSRGAASHPALPRTLRNLIESLTAVDPQARPNAEQLCFRLQQMIDAPARRWRRGLLTAVMMALVAVALAVSVGLRRESIQRESAENARDDAEATAGFLTDLLAAPAPELQGREIKVAELLDTAALRLRSQSNLPAHTQARLLLTIGQSQLALHKPGAATSTLAFAKTQSERSIHRDPAIEQQIGVALVRTLVMRERWQEADAAIVALRNDDRWRNDANVIVNAAILRAIWWHEQGKIEDAQRSLEGVDSASPGVPVALRIELLHAQALIAFAQRQLTRTEALVKQALALVRDQGLRFGGQEFELRSLLGNTYSEQGKLDEAEQVYRGLVASVEVAYGKDSPTSLYTWLNVATSLKNNGRFTEAEALIRVVLPKIENTFGERSVAAINLRSTLSSTLLDGGRPLDALTELATLIPLDVDHYGAEHPQTLIDRFNRLEAMNFAGHHREALDEGRDLRGTMESVFGSGHPFVLETDDAIGYALTFLGRAQEAEAIHRRSRDFKRLAIGEDNPYTLLSSEYLARALLALKRNGEAERELEKLLEARQRVLGPEHPKSKETQALLRSTQRL